MLTILSTAEMGIEFCTTTLNSPEVRAAKSHKNAPRFPQLSPVQIAFFLLVLHWDYYTKNAKITKGLNCLDLNSGLAEEEFKRGARSREEERGIIVPSLRSAKKFFFCQPRIQIETV